MALMSWGDRWVPSDDGAPLILRHRHCGEDVDAVVVCSHCGETLRFTDTLSIAGPGSRVAPGIEVGAARLRDSKIARTTGVEVPSRHASTRTGGGVS
jgi:hypothetical protein